VPEAAVKFGLPAPGDVIAGKYRILRSIGEGGMGHVFEAAHVRMGHRVAIKVLKPSASQSPEVMTRFDREARAAGRLRGRHVARVIDVDATPDRLPYMVMEFLEGRDLQTELDRRRTFPVEEAIDYVLQACAGIAEAHDIGIVHRDLKPSNLFLCDEGDRRIVKILDFGISKILDEASKLTSTELTIGTPLYMSPEQVRSARTVDARTDVWALGIILFELLTGRPPWVGSAPAVAAAIVTDPPPPLSDFRADVPPAVEAAMRHALEKKADDRFPDVRALASALIPFCESPNSLGRVSLESAMRAAQSGVALVSTGPRTSSSLGHAATVLSALPESSSGAESAYPPSDRRKVGATTAGWSTASGQRATQRSRFLFGAALAAAVAAVAIAVSVVLVMRGSGKGGVRPDSTAVAAPGTATTADVSPVAPPVDPALPLVATASASASVNSGTSGAIRPPGRPHGPRPGNSPASPSPAPPSAAPTSSSSKPPPLHL
jgi:eukaryotic-like serine/threonine-protein kinase